MTSFKYFIKAIGSMVLFSTMAWGLLSCQPQSPKVSGTKDGLEEKTSGKQNQISGDIPLFDTHSELLNYLLVDCDTTTSSSKKSKDLGYNLSQELSQLSQKSAYYNCIYWVSAGSSNATHFCGKATGCYAPPQSLEECMKQVITMQEELSRSDNQGHAEQVKNQPNSKKNGQTGAQGKSNSDTSQDVTVSNTPKVPLPDSIKEDTNGSSHAKRACEKMFPSSTP